MQFHITTPNKVCLLLLFFTFFGKQTVQAQELNTNLDAKNTYHNQLFFNRFLINPTFSLVRENKSYINILHRNQYAAFEDNSQNYFLGFSNKLNDHTALGISVYSNWSGVVQEFGFNANYAKSVQLGAKSKLAFGTNISYYNTGIDKNRIVVTAEDRALSDARKENKVAIQPGVTLSVGRFDVGVYARDLFEYNQTTNSFLTDMSTQGLRASLQYNHPFTATRGLFEDARLMPLVQLGQKQDGSLAYVGSMLLDLPNYGWLQTTYDEDYGLSMGLGFNVSKKMSLGYLLEKDIAQEDTDLGWNHEVSLAYTFKDNDSPGAYASTSEDAKVDQIIRNYEEQILQLRAEKDALAQQDTNRKAKKAKKQKTRNSVSEGEIAIENNEHSLAYENRLILDELILRQDSIENARTKAFEKRFETIFTLLRNDLKHTMKNQLQDVSGTHNTAIAQSKKKNISRKKAIKNTEVAAIETKKKVGLTPLQKIRVEEELQRITRTRSTIGTTKVGTTNKEQSSNETIKKQQAKVKTTQNAEVTGLDGLDTIEHNDYVELPIRVMDQTNFENVSSGYYVIANVYKSKKYLTLFMNDLKKQGLDARQFYNKENGLYYVYLADFNYKDEARDAFVSNLDGKYQKEKWIMEVADNSAIVDNMYIDQ